MVPLITLIKLILMLFLLGQKILKKINNSKLVLKTSSKRLATKRLKELFKKNDVLESVRFLAKKRNLLIILIIIT